MTSKRLENFSWLSGLLALITSLLTNVSLGFLAVCVLYLIAQCIYAIIRWPSEKQGLTLSLQEQTKLEKIGIVHSIVTVLLIVAPILLAVSFLGLNKAPDFIDETVKEAVADPIFQNSCHIIKLDSIDSGTKGDAYVALKAENGLMMFDSKNVYRHMFRPVNYWILGSVGGLLIFLAMGFFVLYIGETLALNYSTP